MKADEIKEPGFYWVKGFAGEMDWRIIEVLPGLKLYWRGNVYQDIASPKGRTATFVGPIKPPE